MRATPRTTGTAMATVWPVLCPVELLAGVTAARVEVATIVAFVPAHATQVVK